MPLPVAPLLSPGFRRFLVAALVLAAAFCLPLFQVVRVALHSELYSYIVLLPFISAYLVGVRRDELRPAGRPVARVWPVLFAIIGLSALAAYLAIHFPLPTQGSLALAMYAFVFLLAASAAWWLGRPELRVVAFPLALLIFLAPFPLVVETALEAALQHGSAWTANAFFELSGMPVMRNDTYFRLPGFSLQVAPECSGIRSTFALFLTSLVAGQLLLRSPWKRAALALVVIPIALLRNGFRVFVIGQLCVRVGPHMIDSWIHRHGGPVFFALSLLPFFLILVLLLRSERRAASVSSPAITS